MAAFMRMLMLEALTGSPSVSASTTAHTIVYVAGKYNLFLGMPV